jgi:molybdopterin-guanine dinucleotide biosynthesis protein MobB
MGNSSPKRLSEQGKNDVNTPMVVSFVSFSGAGKTTFLEKLVPELKMLGIRVGVLKHHTHPTPFDVPGKDTYRLSEAGADIVIGVGPVQTAIFIPADGPTNLEGVIQRHLTEVDLVLTEGYKRGRHPKIEVHRASRSDKNGVEEGLLCDATELLAVVTDEPLTLPETVPQFDLDDAPGVARLLAGLLSND